MHVPIKVKSPNNISEWQIGFNSAFKGLIITNIDIICRLYLGKFPLSQPEAVIAMASLITSLCSTAAPAPVKRA